MKRLLFFLAVNLLHFSLFAQDDAYYKEVSLRKKSFEIQNLPNLESEFSSFYFGISGGLRFTKNFETPNFSEIGQNISHINEVLEVNLGFNRNKKWFVETGILQIKNNLVSNYLNSPDLYPFSSSINSSQLYVPLTFKRQLLSLNKVNQNASINMLAGLAYQVYSNHTQDSNYSGQIDPRAHSANLSEVYFFSNQSTNPFLGQFGLEVRGNVTENIELLVFSKALFRENKYITHGINLDYSGGTQKKFEIYERPQSFVLGLQLRFNSKRFHKYYSSI